jgi:hypothetical protein
MPNTDRVPGCDPAHNRVVQHEASLVGVKAKNSKVDGPDRYILLNEASLASRLAPGHTEVASYRVSPDPLQHTEPKAARLAHTPLVTEVAEHRN